MDIEEEGGNDDDILVPLRTLMDIWYGRTGPHAIHRNDFTHSNRQKLDGKAPITKGKRAI
jgi:hypothetical protein